MHQERTESGTWVLKLGIKQWNRTIRHNISNEDKERISSILKNPFNDDCKFITYDTQGATVLLNLHHLTHCQILRETEADFDFNSKGEYLNEIQVFMEGSQQPLRSPVNLDEIDGNKENETRLAGLIFDAEMLGDKGSIISLIDMDGEELFLRSEAVIMIVIPRAHQIEENFRGEQEKQILH